MRKKQTIFSKAMHFLETIYCMLLDRVFPFRFANAYVRKSYIFIMYTNMSFICCKLNRVIIYRSRARSFYCLHMHWQKRYLAVFMSHISYDYNVCIIQKKQIVSRERYTAMFR